MSNLVLFSSILIKFIYCLFFFFRDSMYLLNYTTTHTHINLMLLTVLNNNIYITSFGVLVCKALDRIIIKRVVENLLFSTILKINNASPNFRKWVTSTYVFKPN